MKRSRHPKYNQTTNDSHNAHFISRLNVRSRVCDTFTPSKDNEKICVCKKSEDDHRFPINKERNSSTERRYSEWVMANNTQEQVDPEYGYVLNKGKSMFARLALDTPVEKVEHILLDAWKIRKPKFIVSIIGGAKYFKLADRLETNFINRIVEIIHKSDAWLVTSGYNIGIVQLVGQALLKIILTKRNTNITAIGICKWGSITNVKGITSPLNGNTRQETKSSSKNQSSSQQKRRRERGEWTLEMNHSHYLMLDDGRLRTFDVEDYRTRLIVHIAKLKEENNVFVPVVTIVVEGGKDTLTNIYYDLRANIPVVLIEGSGRAADFLNNWLAYTKGVISDTKDEDPDDRERIWEINEFECEKKDTSGNHIDADLIKLKKIFHKYRDALKKDLTDTFFHTDDDDENLDDQKEEIDKATVQVMFCLQPAIRFNITGFNLDSDNNLSETILRSICQSRQKLLKQRQNEERTRTTDRYQPNAQISDDEGNLIPDLDRRNSQSSNEEKRKRADYLSSLSRIDQNNLKAEQAELLDLAMDWDCIDVAREFIFQNSLANILHPETYFIKALQKNLPMFVYEFLKLGIHPSKIFFPGDLFSKGPYRYINLFKDLYTHESVDSSKTHSKVSGEKIDNIESLNRRLRQLIGDYMQKLYFNTFREEFKHRASWGLLNKSVKSLLYEFHENESEKFLQKKKAKLKQLSQDYIMRDLFIWAVLMSYTHMAKVFLLHMKYRLCPALIASKIFKQYHQEEPYGELRDSYKKKAKYFEDYAINCLDICDDHDVNKSCEIILQQNKLYGYISCFQVAASAKNKSFIAAPCSVQAMNNIWYNKLRPEQKRNRDKAALFVGFITLGLAAPAFVEYRQIKWKPKPVDSDARALKTYGINYSDPNLLEYSDKGVKDPLHIRYIRKFKKFHLSSSTKFFYHVVTYLFFLLLFSYTLLFNFERPSGGIPSIYWTEILTIMLVSFMLIEEIRYFCSQDNLTFIGRVEHYFNGFFRGLTLIAFVLFYIGLIVRFRRADSDEDFIAARIIMAIDLEIWWLRTLSFAYVFSFLGPQVVAIGKMLKDLLFFVCIIAIVMIAYGVASRSMVYYPIVNGFTTETGGQIDTTFDGRNVFRQIVYPVYYLLYGRLDDELDNLNDNPNAGWSIATQVLLAFHMLFVNILLVNLLIAIFSKRFDEVYEETQEIWRSQQHSLTREYYIRSPFFPPISFFFDIYYLSRLLMYSIRKCCKLKVNHKAEVFKIITDKDYVIEEWCKFEEEATYEYAYSEVKALKTTLKKSTYGSDLGGKEDKGEISNIDSDGKDTLHNFEEAQYILTHLTSIAEEVKLDMDKMAEEKKQKLNNANVSQQQKKHNSKKD